MAEPSLRHGLTLRVLAVAVILLMLDAIACYVLAIQVANYAYDRWLQEDTLSLAQAVRVYDKDIRLYLPPVARAVFKYNSDDENYYRLTTAHNGIVAQDGDLPPLRKLPGSQPLLSNGFVAGQPARIVAMRVAPPDTDDTGVLEVAETLNKRASLASRILLEMAAPQLALVLIAAVFAWSVVRTGLSPLTALAGAIESRGDQLAPVPEAGLPREALVLARRINQLLARQERALQAQRRFVADAAHQLRTPLAQILLHTEHAERATSEEPRRQALRGLHTSVARAARLSHQLLALARAEPEAASNLSLVPLDLVAVARSAGEDWISPAYERGIDFGFVAPSQAVMIQGHQGLLGELISNLIDNALRYCPRGSNVTLAVSAGATPVLSVEDDGPGIPADSRERVFERFYRGSSSSGEGCGLGLAIVREIATAHGAWVQVLPGHEGRGVCFEVRFPAAARRDLVDASGDPGPRSRSPGVATLNARL